MADDSPLSFFSRLRGVAPTSPRTNQQSTSISSSSSSDSIGHCSSSITTPVEIRQMNYRITQFETLLSAENADLQALKKISWNGIPNQYRSTIWQLFLGYLPTNKSRRESAINRKRKEYLDSIPIYYESSAADRTTQEGETLRQILVDLPRTCPNTPFFQQPVIQKAMERILYIWSIRHPASGYVQGIDDLLTPLLIICMQPFFEGDIFAFDAGSLPPSSLMSFEADAFWCLTKLLDSIQDHYTSSQPGLQRMVMRLEDLTHRLDNELHSHFQEEGLIYMQFAFRWMNCLLLRELPLKCIIRLWDTYLSEESGGYENFHVYVCAVLLKSHRDRLISMPFQDMLLFLQEIPTSTWGESDVEPVLSQAYILSTLFDNSPSHLT